MPSISPDIQTWAHDLDSAGIFDLLIRIESGQFPNRWPGTFLLGPRRDATVTIDPDEAFTWLCIDPNSKSIHHQARYIADFDFEITGRHRLDRALALTHALHATISDTHDCVDRWQPVINGDGQPSELVLLDEPSEPEFPEPYTMYMGQEFGKSPPGGELSPMGRMVALQVALRSHLRLSGTIDAVIQGRAPALNAAIMQRGLLTEPEGCMAWDFNQCIDELQILLGSGNRAPAISSLENSSILTVMPKPFHELEDRLQDALLAIARSTHGLSPLQLGREVFGDGISDHECRNNAKQWKKRLVDFGYPITRGRYRLVWERLDRSTTEAINHKLGK